MDFAEKGARAHTRKFGRLFGFEFEDYRSAAFFGLVTAARKFEPERGWTFKTYAFNWCERFMRDLYRRQRRANGWAYNANKAEQAAGASRTEMVKRVHVGAWPTIVSKDGDEEPIDVAGQNDDPVESIERQQKRAMVLASCRTERERIILSGRLDGLSLDGIGEQCGLSRGRIQQLLPGILERAQRYVQGRTMRISNGNFSLSDPDRESV